MTHLEDIKRLKMTNTQKELMQYKNSRIEALEKKVVSLENRIEFLQAQIEVAKEAMFNKYK